MTYHSKCSDRLAAHQYVVQACGGQPGVYVTFIETRFWDTISQEHERGEKWRLQVNTFIFVPVCPGIGQVKIRSRLRCIRRESGERHDGFVRVILDGDWLVCGDAREDEEG